MEASFRLHHIGILVRDIVPAAAQLTSRFGYIVDSDVIEDPVQTAVVQFLRLPGSEHWTELVAPNGPNSKLQGAIDRKRSGTHHLCYEVEDIVAACERLRNQAMSLIAEPVPGVAFGGRRIAWLMDRQYMLVELVESGPGPLSLARFPR